MAFGGGVTRELALVVTERKQGYSRGVRVGPGGDGALASSLQHFLRRHHHEELACGGQRGLCQDVGLGASPSPEAKALGPPLPGANFLLPPAGGAVPRLLTAAQGLVIRAGHEQRPATPRTSHSLPDPAASIPTGHLTRAGRRGLPQQRLGALRGDDRCGATGRGPRSPISHGSAREVRVVSLGPPSPPRQLHHHW